jgi:hypothetical protein
MQDTNFLRGPVIIYFSILLSESLHYFSPLLKLNLVEDMKALLLS